LLRDLTIGFDKDQINETADVNSIIKITSTLKPGSKASWNTVYFDVAL